MELRRTWNLELWKEGRKPEITENGEGGGDKIVVVVIKDNNQS